MFQQFVLQPSEPPKTKQSVDGVLTIAQYAKQIPLEKRQYNTAFETFFDQLLKFNFDFLIKWNGNPVLTQLLKDLEKERPNLEIEADGMGKRADINKKDGKISKAELRKLIQDTNQVREKMFLGQKESRNKDGLQLYNWGQAMKQMTGGTKELATLSQFKEWFINNRLKTMAKQIIDGFDSNDKSQLFAALPTEVINNLFTKFDTDTNDRISINELSDLLKYFKLEGKTFSLKDKFDTNKNGLELSEILKMIESLAPGLIKTQLATEPALQPALQPAPLTVTLDWKYEFPEGLKKLNNSMDKDKVKYVVPPSEEKTAQARIDRLIRDTFGGVPNKTSADLNILLSKAYLPYLHDCCLNNQPLIHRLPSGIKLSHGCITTRPVRSGLRTEQNTLNDTEEKINRLLNEDLSNFMAEFGDMAPYTRDQLAQGNLLGSFYTKKQLAPNSNPYKNKTTLANPSMRIMADVIQNMVNLGDADAHNTIERLYGKTLSDGPIQSRFYRLNLNVNQNGYKKSINGRYGTFNQLLGICGHSPVGALPFIYYNNMCCDTTYAAGDPLRRPALSIEAVLKSNSNWEFLIKLDKGQEATVVDSDGNMGKKVMISEYSIRSSFIPKDPLREKPEFYRHFVGRYQNSDNETKEIWRHVVQSRPPDPVELDHATNEFSPKFWSHNYEYTVHAVDLVELRLLEYFHQYDVIDDNGLMYIRDVFTANDLERFAANTGEDITDAKIGFEDYRDLVYRDLVEKKESGPIIPRLEASVVTGARYNIISDIEGNLPFFTRCMELIDKTNTLVVLGDMWDRGTAKDEKKIWTDLSELKKTLPNLITIVGNRDINKLRWLMELNNFIPR
tara:strand:- start:3799 stop:6333 length:2535 start_codon:yes stop_codon:yes gene_type:complete